MNSKSKAKSIAIANMIFKVIIMIILIVYCISLLYPLLWALLGSFKGRLDFRLNPMSWPEQFIWSNYINVFREISKSVETASGGTRMVYMWEMLFNSLVYSLGAAFLSTFAACLTSYTCAKYKFNFGKVIYSVAIITMILPVVGSLPSALRIMSGIGFKDNIVGVWIMQSGGLGFNFLVLYGTFKGISSEYAEAARVDGASHATIFFRIMMPLAKASFFALFLLSFIGVWNDYMTPMLYLPNMPTIAYGIFDYQFNGGNGASSIPSQLAGSALAMLPILVVFLCFQKTLMSNISAGGLKG